MVYEIMAGTRRVGQARMEREGLYYRISCRCQMDQELCRITVTCGGRLEDLGICVPMDGGFGMDTKIPCKRLGEGTPEFRLLGKKDIGIFVAVYPEEPFAYMTRLKDAFLTRQRGVTGIIIPE